MLSVIIWLKFNFYDYNAPIKRLSHVRNVFKCLSHMQIIAEWKIFNFTSLNFDTFFRACFKVFFLIVFTASTMKILVWSEKSDRNSLHEKKSERRKEISPPFLFYNFIKRACALPQEKFHIPFASWLHS